MMKELIIMKSLNWELSPATANCWLGIYMQLANVGDETLKENRGQKMELKQFSSHTFVQASRLLDLCTMDMLSLRYSYSTIAAAAVYHTIGERVALDCSGYTWDEISSCIYWMTPHAMALREAGEVEVKTFSQIPLDDSHNIQVHNVDLGILVRYELNLTGGRWALHSGFRFAGQESAQCRVTEPLPSPTGSLPSGMLTPPSSKNKGRSNGPLSPVLSNSAVLTPSTAHSDSPRCSTTSDWSDDQPAFS